MGSKKALLIVLGLILLSSSVIAVDFEWAFGDSRTNDAYGDFEYNIGESYSSENTGAYGPNPIEPRMLVVSMYSKGSSPSGGCGLDVHVRVEYQNDTYDIQNDIETSGEKTNYVYLIGDSVSYGWHTESCYAWCALYTGWGATGGGLVGCCNNCYVRGKFDTKYVQVSVTGKNSVFVQDQVKSIGTIYDLMSDQLPSAGETVYLGVGDSTDVVYWIGKQGEAYNGQKEITDPAPDDYLNVCADTNSNGQCDYDEANVQKCFNAGGDWYKDICCGEDAAAINQATGLTAVNCSYQGHNYGIDIYAICGKTLDGRWQWAPLAEEYGNIHELLSCPGLSFVADKDKLYGCKGGSVQGVTDTVVQGTQSREISIGAPWWTPSSTNYIPITGIINISGKLGTHEYICSSGQIFECAGDIASYTHDIDSVAETGLTSSELLGSGGCPPKIISYWTFDDGTAKDTKGIFNGNKVGATASNGKISGGLSFTGTDRVEIPANLSVGNEFTVEAWIKPTDVSGVRKIIEKAGAFRVAVSDGILIGAVNTGAGLVDFGSRAVVQNLWYHVALAYDGVSAKLYLNGVAVEDTSVSANISWSNQPIIIGSDFIGEIDEVAIYGKALRGSLITLHAKNPLSYCQVQSGNATIPDSYCAADGDWTTDLDIKDMSSCNKAGFHWTGTMCCSELDDPAEYYNEHDAPAADLSTAVVARHAGAQVESGQVILSNLGHYATIKGPALLSVETYSAESATDIGSCPKLSTVMVPVAPWESKIIQVLNLGDSSDPCRYRWKIISSQPILAAGGCWNKTFVERGNLLNPKILNYQGAFFGCAIPTGSPFLALKDTHTNNNLLTNLQPTCAGLKLHAAGPGNHSVCGPGGIWLYTSDARATFAKNISWDPSDYGITVLSVAGCCRDDQCWDGFGCVDSGTYYSVGEDAFVCRQ